VACGDDTPSDPTTTGQGTGGDGGSGGQAIPDVGAIIPCPPGELELSDGSCKAPGIAVDACAAGFVHDGNAGCTPTLPAAACPGGLMALVGETSCREVSACGGGTWGDIPTDNTTQHVDQNYNGGNSNGSSSAPWVTIQQGLAAVGSGGTVAVAAGNYSGSLTINKSVKLWGTCASAVNISMTAFDGIRITTGGDNSEIRGLSVTSSGAAITVEGVAALVEGVRVHDTGWNGIAVQRQNNIGATLTLRGSLVETAISVGVSVRGSTLVMEDSVVRDTQPASGGTFGRGISLETEFQSAQGSTGTIRRSVVQGNYESGIALIGSTATVEASVIENTLGQQLDGLYGLGVVAWPDQGLQLGSDLSVSDSVVRDNHLCGIQATDSDLLVERSVARDTLPETGSMSGGYGMRSYSFRMAPTSRPSVVVRDSLIDGAFQGGFPVVGTDLDMESTIVRNVQPRASDGNFGRGITIEVSYDNLEPATGNLRGVVVENVLDAGIFAVGAVVDMDSVYVRNVSSRANDGIFGAGVAYATEVLVTKLPASGTVNRVVVENCQAAGFGVAGADVVASNLIVRNTLPQAMNDEFGDGIVVSSFLILIPDIVPTTLELTRATVAENARAGIATFGATVSMLDTLVDCNAIDLDGEPIKETPYVLNDLGNNQCPCGGGGCRVLSSGLAPPQPVSL
jgi:hypothetical protein